MQGNLVKSHHIPYFIIHYLRERNTLRYLISHFFIGLMQLCNLILNVFIKGLIQLKRLISWKIIEGNHNSEEKKSNVVGSVEFFRIYNYFIHFLSFRDVLVCTTHYLKVSCKLHSSIYTAAFKIKWNIIFPHMQKDFIYKINCALNKNLGSSQKTSSINAVRK